MAGNTTLFADASFCFETGSAGWGAWYITDGMPGGQFLGGRIQDVKSAGEAEIMALALAIERMTVEIPDGYFVVQSDCLRALQLMAGNLPTVRAASRKQNGTYVVVPSGIKPNAVERAALDRMAPHLEGRKVFVRHVKGHSYGSGRSWVNRMCDDIAKRKMMEGREEYRREGA